MDFSFNDDHLALRDAVQRFCDAEYPAQQRGNSAPAAQTAQRRQALAELGVLGLPLATEFGGSAQGAVEVLLVAQELGRALADETFLGSTIMAGQLLTHLGSHQQQQRWIPALASGERTAAVALYEPGARYDWQSTRLTTATRQGESWLLNGRKAMVLGGDSADVLLVLARSDNDGTTQGKLNVFAIDVDTKGLQIQGFDTLDNRRAAHLVLDQVSVSADRLLQPNADKARNSDSESSNRYGSGNVNASDNSGSNQTSHGTTVAAIEAMLDAANAALCAEAVGAVTALLAHTAEHLRTRKQFGAPLAKFQVLQHRVADMAIALEQLKSMACAAAMAAQVGDPVQRRRVVSAAKVLAAQQGRAIGLAAIQLHGAMGMTDECRVGHYAKRLIVNGQLLGDAAWHLNALTQSNLRTSATSSAKSAATAQPN